MEEEFRDIPGYEGLYQASNLGRIYSLPKKHRYCNHDGKILVQSKSKNKMYYDVVLRKEGKGKTYFVHTLVAMTFLNYKPGNRKIVIDHIDNDQSNNTLANLQILSNRENSSKDKKGFVSAYVGVQKSWSRWKALIRIEGYQLHLGSDLTEVGAHKMYIAALSKYDKDPEFYRNNIKNLSNDKKREYLLN